MRRYRPADWVAAFPAAIGGEFVKAGERGVEVCLVEDLEAADHVAFEREKMTIIRHSASKPSATSHAAGG